MKQFFIVLCLILSVKAYTQHSFQAIIKDEHSGEPLIGASVHVEGTSLGAVSDATGLAIVENIPAGPQEIEISFVGYQAYRKVFEFPLTIAQPLTVLLEEGEAIEEITVTATRSTRTIENIPTRIEFLGAEELAEKAVMNSTNIAMLLRESTGIQMQQTSASSANQSIRIQGLDGRYTQILKDGFPLFGGFAGGLSIMQIPPLDLKQVEVIKGSASTLYGGGAIAGLINLVTKKPELERPELSLMLNQTSAGGTTANGFYASRSEKAGLSLYASANRQDPYDPNDDGFSDIPKVRSLTFTPRFFLYPDENTTLWLGVNTTLENRIGGDLQVIDGEPDAQHTYSEENRSKRFSTQLSLDREFANGALLRVRNSVGLFDREVIIPNYQFAGKQLASFSEVSYTTDGEKGQLILGGNLFTDRFREDRFGNSQIRDYQNTTLGGFAQHTWDLNNSLALESGLRTDFNSEYGTFVLPRLSLLFKVNSNFSGRIGGGMGYKLPTIFTEEAEGRTFRNILPINTEATEAERSIGGNFDLNYQTVIGDQVTFSINQLFFYTQLDEALVLQQNEGPTNYSFVNADGTVETKGFETNIKFTYLDFKLFLQYAFIDARLNYLNTNDQKPLTPKHNAGAVLVFEQHGKWRLGLESYYTGQQFRSDFSQTRDYWIVGFMALRQLKHFSLFLNFENFIDTRQSRYQDIVRPPVNDPTFAEIWAPTDGFVINGGFIWNLFAKEEEHHHH